MNSLAIKTVFTTHRTQIENLLSLMLIQVLNTLIPFFLFPYLVKTLGQVQYGKAAFVVSLINFLQIIVDFGFNYTGTRLVALSKSTEERSELFFGIFFIKFLLYIICLGILCVTALFIAKVKALFDLFVISSALLLGNVVFPVWFFQGMEKMKIISGVNFFIRILSLLLIISFVKGPQHTERYIIINSCSNFLPGLFCFFYCTYLFKLQFKLPSIKKMKTIFHDGKDLFLSNLIIGGYSSIRIFVAGIFTTGELLGVYSIIERIYFIIQTFPLVSFLQATYPKLVKNINDNRQKVIRFMRRATHYFLLYFIIAVSAFWVVQRWILGDFLKVKLPANYPLLSAVLGITLILVNYNAFKLEFLLISGNDKLYRIIHFFTGIVGAVSLLFFTYKWGIIGCGLSVLLTQVSIVIYTAYTYKKNLGFVL